jgi:hypothetical protein
MQNQSARAGGQNRTQDENETSTWHEAGIEEEHETIAEGEPADMLNAVAAAIPRMFASIERVQETQVEIQKTIQEIVSYCKSIFLASASIHGKEGNQQEERIVRTIHPASSIFTNDYVIAAATPTVMKFILDLTKDVNLQTEHEGPQRALESVLYSAMPTEKKRTKDTDSSRLHAYLKTLLAKVLIVNSRTRALACYWAIHRVEWGPVRRTCL